MKHNEISAEQIIAQCKAVGCIGRHKHKTSNGNINKKLNKMVKEGVLYVSSSTNKFRYFKLTNGEIYRGNK